MKPPDHLSQDSKTFWTSTVGEYSLESHHLKILQCALEAWDEMVEAKRIVDAEGLIFVDRFGQPRPHPAAGLVLKARESFGRLMRQLDLEGEPNPGYRR